jgi:hypothetical protein
MPDPVPIEVGHHYTPGLSPDGRTLAVISWPNGSNNAGASLLLIDLSTWTVRSTGVVINDSVLGPFYSSDGMALWWANPGWHDRAHSMPRGYSLVRYDLASGQLATVFTFAESFAPWQIRAMHDGQHVAVFGVPTSTGNLTEDAPRVQVVDIGAGALAADVQLAGLKAGQFEVGPGDVPAYPYHMYRPALAWDLARSRVYVVYPDEERVSGRPRRRQSDGQRADAATCIVVSRAAGASGAGG